MRRILTTYLAVLLLLSIGFFGVGALATAQELRDPMQPPPFALKKFRQAEWAKRPKAAPSGPAKPKPKPLELTSILFSRDRRIAIIDDQMLKVGDRIRGMTLVALSRDTARLVHNGKVLELKLNSELAAIRKHAVEDKP